MAKVLAEVRRVLRPGRGAVFVVGNSVIRGVDLRIADCFAELGERVGLCVAGVGVRRIDRDRRMLPVSAKRRPDSQIERRMMEEYVVGFYKPLVAAASCERVSGHGA
jgi:ubiquinone/menaquinone biosynthesis C-methylase UbiE